MTHAQAEAHLKAGRSVGIKVNGSVIHVTKLEDLPSEDVVAKGNPAQEQAAVHKLLTERAKLDQQLANLGVSDAAAVTVAPVTVVTDPNAPAKNRGGRPRKPNEGTGEGAGNGEGTDGGEGSEGGDGTGNGDGTEVTEEQRKALEAAANGQQTQP